MSEEFLKGEHVKIVRLSTLSVPDANIDIGISSSEEDIGVERGTNQQ